MVKENHEAIMSMAKMDPAETKDHQGRRTEGQIWRGPGAQ